MHPTTVSPQSHMQVEIQVYIVNTHKRYNTTDSALTWCSGSGNLVGWSCRGGCASDQQKSCGECLAYVLANQRLDIPKRERRIDPGRWKRRTETTGTAATTSTRGAQWNRQWGTTTTSMRRWRCNTATTSSRAPSLRHRASQLVDAQNRWYQASQLVDTGEVWHIRDMVCVPTWLVGGVTRFKLLTHFKVMLSK